jgi:hypothetical protein
MIVMNDVVTGGPEALSPVAFARLVWRVGEVARRFGLSVPGFRDAPTGVVRHLRRRAGQQPVVVLTVRNRTESAVLADVVDGVLAVNPGVDPAIVEAFIDELQIFHVESSAA